MGKQTPTTEYIDGTITLKDIVKYIAKKTGKPSDEIKLIIREFLDCIIMAYRLNHRVKIFDFGIFIPYTAYQTNVTSYPDGTKKREGPTRKIRFKISRRVTNRIAKEKKLAKNIEE